MDDERLDDLRLTARAVDRAERAMSSFPRVTPGERLYWRWCGSRTSDRARYFRMMNPAERRAWEDLAADLVEQDAEVFERVVRNILAGV